MKAPLCIAFLMVALTVQAPDASSQSSTEASASVSGPSMDRTIDFLQENLAKQTEVTAYWMAVAGKPIPSKYEPVIAHLEDACSFVHEYGFVTVIHLDRTDPLSVSITPITDAAHQTVYRVRITRAVYENRAFPVQTSSPEIPEPATGHDEGGNLYSLSGIVRSIDGSSIVYQSRRGRFTQIMVGPKDRVSVTVPSAADTVYVQEYPGKLGDIAVGDTIHSLPRDGGGYDIGLTKNMTLPHPFTVVDYLNEDLAQRVAKALIHAIVLCHKNDKPSPF